MFINSYYNSISLSQKLLKSGTYISGTLKRTKKNCKATMNTQLRKGESIIKYSEGVFIGKWRDKGDVLFLSTEFTGEMEKINNKRNIELERPNTINKCNKYILSVEKKDQMLAYNPCEKRTIRWYKKIGLFILQLLLLNANYLYNKYGNSKISYYDFRLEVISDLLQTKKEITKKPKLLPINEHLPSHLPRLPTGKIARKDCRVCTRKKIRKMTNYCCNQCYGTPGLCLEPCFKKWHTT